MGKVTIDIDNLPEATIINEKDKAIILQSGIAKKVSLMEKLKTYIDGIYATVASLASYVSLTGDQTIAGVKTFSSSPIVPTPTTQTQAANKSYVDTAVTGLFDFKGSTNCSANPNYPSGVVGDAYVVSVAGKIGGASGKTVEAGDMYIAIADNAGGTEASVGTSWVVIEHNLLGALLSANNLSDVANAATARNNLAAKALIDTAVALTDAATIDITAAHHTLTTASSRTFTKSYTGDSVKMAITLNATSATFTLPTGDNGIYNGTPSGTNTLVVTGATSGDIIVVAIEKVGSVNIWVGRNSIR